MSTIRLSEIDDSRTDISLASFNNLADLSIKQRTSPSSHAMTLNP
jgi:hypothetical protein